MNNTLINIKEIANEKIDWVLIGKKIIFYSQYLINKITDLLSFLRPDQVKVLFTIIALVGLYFGLKHIVQPITKIILVVAIVWFLLGFFV